MNYLSTLLPPKKKNLLIFYFLTFLLKHLTNKLEKYMYVYVYIYFFIVNLLGNITNDYDGK